MNKSKTKADELRDASKILWHGGIALSTIYVKSALPQLPNLWLIPIYIICMFLQYGITKFESAIFNGSIPPPWSDKATTKTTSVWVGAVFVLLMDLVINLGGVGTVANFLKASATGDVLKNNFGANEAALNIITGLIIIALAFLFAVGSELLKIYAETIEEPVKSVEFKEVKQTEESEKITKDRNEQFDLHRKKNRDEIDAALLTQQQLLEAKSRAVPNKRKP